MMGSAASLVAATSALSAAFAGRRIQLQEDVDVCMDARYRTNSTGVLYLGQFSSHKECETAVLAVPTSTAMWYADKDYSVRTARKEAWGEACYARTDDKYKQTKRKHCSSGRVVAGGPPPPPPPAPGPPPGHACPFNCSLNGACTAAGKCSCDPAWVGDHCQTLALLPATLESGLRQFNVAAAGGSGGGGNGTIPGNTSTWGGATLYDPKTARWFMVRPPHALPARSHAGLQSMLGLVTAPLHVAYVSVDQWATELTAHCGMHTWTTNSHTVRASSADPLGLCVVIVVVTSIPSPSFFYYLYHLWIL